MKMRLNLIILFQLTILSGISLAAVSSIRDPNSTAVKVIFPEGYLISGRQAKLIRHPEEPRWFLIFSFSKSKISKSVPKKSDPYATPIEVLPGKWLTAMTKVTTIHTDIPVTSRVWRVWGEVTTYRQRNFIRPTTVATESIFGNKKSIQNAGQKNAPNSNLNSQNQAKNKPQNLFPTKSDMPDKLRKQLMKLPPTHVLNIPKDTQKPTLAKKNSVKLGSSGTAKAIWKDGHMVIDRLGRLIFDSEQQQYMFVFEADGSSLNEPPVMVHPNSLLEVMQDKFLGTSVLPLKFRISGCVSKYKNRNYILLRKFLMVPEKGNLGK